jgi:hypothetical protein
MLRLNSGSVLDVRKSAVADTDRERSQGPQQGALWCVLPLSARNNGGGAKG